MNSTSDDTGGGRPQKTAGKDHKKVPEIYLLGVVSLSQYQL